MTKEEFIKKWSVWHRNHTDPTELTKAFERNLNEVISSELHATELALK